MLITIICDKCNKESDIDINLFEEIPNRFDCPICKSKKSCYRKWTANFKIPWNFRATEINNKIPLNFKKRKKQIY